MADNQGTHVNACIVPQDDQDAYPSHDEKYGKGGYRVVADLTARDAITPARRTEGMLVKVLADGLFYTLSGGITNGDWVEETMGDGGAPVVINTFPHEFSPSDNGKTFYLETAAETDSVAFNGEGYIVTIIDSPNSAAGFTIDMSPVQGYINDTQTPIVFEGSPIAKYATVAVVANTGRAYVVDSNQLTAVYGYGTDSIIDKTYAELYNGVDGLIDLAQLVPGQKYEIVDFRTNHTIKNAIGAQIEWSGTTCYNIDDEVTYGVSLWKALTGLNANRTDNTIEFLTSTVVRITGLSTWNLNGPTITISGGSDYPQPLSGSTIEFVSADTVLIAATSGYTIAGSITISGSTNGNDGTYTIISVTDNGNDTYYVQTSEGTFTPAVEAVSYSTTYILSNNGQFTIATATNNNDDTWDIEITTASFYPVVEVVTWAIDEYTNKGITPVEGTDWTKKWDCRQVGEIEALVVTAATATTLEPIAVSKVHPTDIIYYEVVYSEAWDTGVSHLKGRITRRIDKWGNDIAFDFRNWRMIRWETTQGSGIYDSFTNTGFGYKIYYLFGGETYGERVPVDGAIQENKIFGESYYENGNPHNIVFINTGDYCQRNTINVGCADLHFGYGCNDVTVGPWCKNIVLGNSHESLTIGFYCRSRIKFAGGSYSNSIGNESEAITLSPTRYCSFGDHGSVTQTGAGTITSLQTGNGSSVTLEGAIDNCFVRDNSNIIFGADSYGCVAYDYVDAKGVFRESIFEPNSACGWGTRLGTVTYCTFKAGVIVNGDGLGQWTLTNCTIGKSTTITRNHANESLDGNGIWSVSYDELVALINGNNLIPNQKYKIINYQTARVIGGTGTEIFTENDEDIVVTADTSNKLRPEAYSVDYPQDIIHYSIKKPIEQDSDFNNLDFQHWGHITYRKDTYSLNEAPYDWRGVKNRRYVDVLDGTLTHSQKSSISETFSGGMGVSYFDVLKSICPVIPNGGLSMFVENSSGWDGIYHVMSVIEAADPDYWTITIEEATDFTGMVSAQYGFYAYGDLYTFANSRSAGLCRGNKLGAISLAEGVDEPPYGSQIPNIVLEDNCAYNETGAYSTDITFTDGCQLNKIGGGSAYNIIKTSSSYNTIGNGSTLNVLNNCTGVIVADNVGNCNLIQCMSLLVKMSNTTLTGISGGYGEHSWDNMTYDQLVSLSGSYPPGQLYRVTDHGTGIVESVNSTVFIPYKDCVATISPAAGVLDLTGNEIINEITVDGDVSSITPVPIWEITIKTSVAMTLTGTAYESISADGQIMMQGTITLDPLYGDSIVLTPVSINNGSAYTVWKIKSRSIYGE